MADPVEPRPRGNWLWLVVIALLAVLLLVWMFSPSGDREGEVEDPIVTGELADPAAEDGAGVFGEGLPEEGAAPPVDPDAPGADTTVDRQPTEEPIAVPEPAVR